jgi:mxaK protein
MNAGIRRALQRSRGPALALVLAALLALLFWQGWQLYRLQSDRVLIAGLTGDTERPVPEDATPEVLLMRAHYLLRHARLEEAQGLGDSPSLREAPAIRAAIYYNLANARIRQATSMMTRQQNDRAVSMISLAIEEYRQALRLKPDDWDIRYNFDYAMRMVRDLPRLQLEQEGELERRPSRKQNWTDLPSLPKGLP